MIGPRRRDVLAAGGCALAAGVAGSVRAHGDPVEILVRSTGDGARVFFDPVGLRLPAGARVRWRVLAGVHTVTACHPDTGPWPRRIPANARPWDSGYLMPGETFELHLAADGVYDYLCLPHEAAGMVGRLVVGDVEADPGYTAGTLSRASRVGFPHVSDILDRGRIRPGDGHGG